MKIRKSLIRSFCQGLLLAGIAALPLATAQAQPGRVQSKPAGTEKSAAIHTAIAAGDLGTAGKLFNQMVDAFLAEGAAQPDPALDQLLAEILIAAGLPREAHPLLDRALAASPAGAEASALHLKRAQVREDLADFAASESDYRLAIDSYASGTPGHRQAVFGLARVLLADKPGESSRLVTQELANANGDMDAPAPLTPPASVYAGWPDNSVARNVARIYALIARDIRSGTRSAPSFRDAVALHEVVDAIERSAAEGAPQ